MILRQMGSHMKEVFSFGWIKDLIIIKKIIKLVGNVHNSLKS